MSVPRPINAAAQDQVGTPYYGLVWLALSTLAYTDESAAEIANIGVDVPKAVKALPDPPAPPGFTQPSSGTWGQWQVEWGPAVDSDNSNLMYVASYRDIASGVPIFAAIGIRGTDTEERHEIRGLLQEIYEDLDAFHTVAWADVVSAVAQTGATPGTAEAGPVAIARGTSDGLKTLLALTPAVSSPQPPGNANIVAFVREFASSWPDVPIVVTGHSLGGCLATVLAMYLRDTRTTAGTNLNLVPQTFAGPTAGTAGFAAKFNTQFPRAHIWWNTLDVVPNGFQNVSDAPPNTPSLRNIHGFWRDHGGPSIDDIEKLVLDGFIDLVHGYTQPSANVQTLIGSVATPSADAGCENTWSTQLKIQHCPPQYHYLISTQCADTVAPYPMQPYSGVCFQVPSNLL